VGKSGPSTSTQSWATSKRADARRSIVSADALNLSPAGLVAVLPITSKHRPLPSRIHIAPVVSTGLTLDSWVITEQVRTISKQRLVSRLGLVTAATMDEVATCLRLLLDLD
jgi:mRNA interferase MazF